MFFYMNVKDYICVTNSDVLIILLCKAFLILYLTLKTKIKTDKGKTNSFNFVKE